MSKNLVAKNNPVIEQDGAVVQLHRRTLADVVVYREFIQHGVGAIAKVAEVTGYPVPLIDKILLDYAYTSSMVARSEGLPFAFLAYGDTTAMIESKLKDYILEGAKWWALIDDVNRAINTLNSPEPATAPGAEDIDPKADGAGEMTT